MWSSWSFSQALKPKIQFIDGFAHFCFTVAQSRIIAQQLQQKVVTDSVILILKKNNFTLKELVSTKDEIIGKTNTKTSYLKSISKNQAIQINELKTDLRKEKRKQKKRSFLTKIGAVVVIISGILIVK